MDHSRWRRIEELLDRFGIKPLVAVIPDNKDPKMKIATPDSSFWVETVPRWASKGWRFALHGEDHVYTTHQGGLVPINRKSEFAGLPLDRQREKIRRGYQKLVQLGVEPDIWVAPSHTFDRNTLIALMDETPIRIVSDGLARTPFTRFGFGWIPQQLWRGRRVGSGVWTICLHPNSMGDKEFERFVRFIDRYQPEIRDWNEIDIPTRPYGFRDLLFFYAFFTVRFAKEVIGWLRRHVVPG
jgi:hypothetical protein